MNKPLLTILLITIITLKTTSKMMKKKAMSFLRIIFHLPMKIPWEGLNDGPKICQKMRRIRAMDKEIILDKHTRKISKGCLRD